MRTHRPVLWLTALLPLGMGWLTLTAGADNLSCLICHNALEGTFTARDGGAVHLHVDGERYAASVHGDLECTTCHMQFVDNPHGTPDEEVDEAIAELSRAIARKGRRDPVALAACIQCHDAAYRAVRESVHGANLFQKGETDGPLCLDCHGSPHEIAPRQAAAEGVASTSPVAYGHIVETCGRCHEQKGISLKYGFSTGIITRYNESFHGKKYRLGGTHLPVCTTCHGAHEVRSQDDPQARVHGANRLKLCGQCHAGANEKFVAAITHKPVGKDNPIPYYAEQGLIILTFLVITACVLHVVLDISALIRTALLVRKYRGRP